MLIGGLQVAVKIMGTQEVSPQLGCLRMDSLVLLRSLEQLGIREGELSGDVSETGTCYGVWIPTNHNYMHVYNKCHDCMSITWWISPAINHDRIEGTRTARGRGQTLSRIHKSQSLYV